MIRIATVLAVSVLLGCPLPQPSGTQDPTTTVYPGSDVHCYEAGHDIYCECEKARMVSR